MCVSTMQFLFLFMYQLCHISILNTVVSNHWTGLDTRLTWPFNQNLATKINFTVISSISSYLRGKTLLWVWGEGGWGNTATSQPTNDQNHILSIIGSHYSCLLTVQNKGLVHKTTHLQCYSHRVCFSFRNGARSYRTSYTALPVPLTHPCKLFYSGVSGWSDIIWPAVCVCACMCAWYRKLHQ